MPKSSASVGTSTYATARSTGTAPVTRSAIAPRSATPARSTWMRGSSPRNIPRYTTAKTASTMRLSLCARARGTRGVPRHPTRSTPALPCTQRHEEGVSNGAPGRDTNSTVR